MLKKARLSQWFNRQKRRIISDLFERHQHLSIILKLLFQNRMKMAFHDMNSISGALKWTIIGWLRTIYKRIQSVMQSHKMIVPWTSVRVFPLPLGKGHKSEQQWTSLVIPKCTSDDLLLDSDSNICSPIPTSSQPHHSKEAAMKNKYISTESRVRKWYEQGTEENDLYSNIFSSYSLRNEEHKEWWRWIMSSVR